MALNAEMQGHYEGYTFRPRHSFESIAPQCEARLWVRDLIRYALSLPISVAVVGMGQLQHVG